MNITHSELHVILRSLTKCECLKDERSQWSGQLQGFGDKQTTKTGLPSENDRKRHTVRPRNRWDIEMEAVSFPLS